MQAIRTPPEIQPVVDLIGVEAALRLVEAHGGVRIEVPSRATPSCALAQVVGLPATEALVREFGGTRMYVPLLKRWRGLMMRRDGASYAEIARRLGVSEQAVWSWLNKADMTAQPGLPGL